MQHQAQRLLPHIFAGRFPDGTVEWTVIDGGCGVLQFNGGMICVERVHFAGLVTGLIFDGTEISVVRDCTVECLNGIWITGHNQRLNNPAIDLENRGTSNVNSVEDCWFSCGQLNFASEGNEYIMLTNSNFEAGQWYGWTTNVGSLAVSNIESEGGHNGWFVGSLAPFNGNASYPDTNRGVGKFENCLIHPNAGTGPAVQASNYIPPPPPTPPGPLVLGPPFLRLSFNRCYLVSNGPSEFVGMGAGNGYRVIDPAWGGTRFDVSSLAALSEYSDSASNATPGGPTTPITGYGCVPQVGVDVNLQFALRAADKSVSPDAHVAQMLAPK